jgi:type IV pilus assembly protein PilQ
LVTLLDQPEPQVEIEARIVVATRNFSRDLGVQLAALVVGNRGQVGSFSTLPGSTNTTGLNPGGIPTGIGVQPNNSLLSSIPNTVIGLTTGFSARRKSAL